MSIPKNIKNYVFRYYRNNTIISHEAFQLQELLCLNDKNDKNDKNEIDKNEIDITKWINLIVGSTQAGKTFLTLALANIYLSIGYSPVFIVKDIFQKTQFLTRYKNDLKKLRHFLIKEGFSKEDISCFNTPLYCDSTVSKKDKKYFNIQLKQSLDGTKKRSILCIWNAKHLKRVYDNIEVHSKFIMFVDEAHKLGAYKKISPDDESTGNENCAYDNIYSQIKILASKLILLTATPQPILVTEPYLYTSGIVVIPESSKYRGIESSKFSLIPKESDEIYLGEEKTKIPASFLSKMSKLSGKQPIKRINKFNQTDFHPINILAKFEVTNEGQYNILNAFKPSSTLINEDHRKIINTNWTVCVMNQEGIRFYNKNLVNISKKSNIFRSSKKINDCEYLFSKEVSIGEILHWCWKNGGVDIFSHIVTIAYKSAEEGLTFCSTWSNIPKKDANWHLTHIYSRNGTTIASFSLEQFLGRINGNHGDQMPPSKIYCSILEKEKQLKSVSLHRKQIRDLCNLRLEHKNERVIEHIHGYEVFDNHVPKEYYGSIKKAKNTLKIKHNPHSHIENQTFLEQSYSKNILALLNENQKNLNENLKDIKVDNKKEKVDKIREILKSIKNNNKNKNYILLSNLDIDKIYSKKEIEELAKFAEYKNPSSMFHSLTTKKSTYGFGCIFEKDGDKWKIQDIFKKAWN